MQVSKIQFSPEELSLAENAEWILTKNEIIRKVMSLFGELASEYRKRVEEKVRELPEEASLFSPKISRGEQYRGLPYVILDYPRIFSKDHVFAVRSFFWWGNYFSLTLHLKGEYKNELQKRIIQSHQYFSDGDFSLAVTEDEWRHDLQDGNYTRVVELESRFEDTLTRKKFLKLTKVWSLQEVNHMESLLANEFSNLLRVIAG